MVQLRAYETIPTIASMCCQISRLRSHVSPTLVSILHCIILVQGSRSSPVHYAFPTAQRLTVFS